MNDPLYAQQPPKRNLKPFIFIAILAIAILIGALILGGGLPFADTGNNPAPTPTPTSTPQGSGLVVDPNAGEYVAPAAKPGVAIPGFGSLTIPAYTEKITGINLYNPPDNEGYYYLTFKLSLVDDSGVVTETLYESQLVPPGLYVQDVTLTRGLAPGTYKAVMHVQPYRIEDTTPTNNADLDLIITVV